MTPRASRPAAQEEPSGAAVRQPPDPPHGAAEVPPAARRELLTPPRIRALLASHGLFPTRSLGQHYLADPNTARKIARLGGAGAGEQVLEVGPGLGSLTLALRETGAQVLAVEIDGRLLPALAAVVGEDPGVRVVQADALHADLAALAPSATRLVANLPYNIAATLVLRVLTEFPQFTAMTVMVQREVGERLACPPGSRGYGAVSVKVAALARAAVAATVSRRVFVPAPHVDSVLVRLDRREHPAAAEVGYWSLARVVDAAFAQRRKTLRNALQRLDLDARMVEAVTAAAGVDPGARAEQLDVAAYAALAAAVRAAGWDDATGHRSPAAVSEVPIRKSGRSPSPQVGTRQADGPKDRPKDGRSGPEGKPATGR